MHIEVRNNGIKDVSVLVADEGKLLHRKGDVEDSISGEVYLGYSYYINGVRQDPPHLDTIDDFEEVDKPEGWPDPEPYIEPEILDEQALNIIINGE